ncbi:MAG: hypothetical protein H8E26_14275 [FCB group bacterium]|nr:hypothetical protein [FCB group bacterium]MBL7027451.1 hypothetical protein [Candidatus Neomarinimicrobiota bacterium]MBL7122064.1 hypothetical protein [Candidatus Neomarinimicrobiota bacterium]
MWPTVKTHDVDGNEIPLEEQLKEAESMATPIDFEGLISEDILEREGSWYRILDSDQFPKHANAKICAFAEGGLVQFGEVTEQNHLLVEMLRKRLDAQKEIQRIEVARLRHKS